MALARFESGRGILRREMLAAIRHVLEEAGSRVPDRSAPDEGGP